MQIQQSLIQTLLQSDTFISFLIQHLSMGTLASGDTDSGTGMARVDACKWIPRAFHTLFVHLTFDRTPGLSSVCCAALFHTLSCCLVKNFALGTIASRHTNQWTEAAVRFITARERSTTTAQTLGGHKASWTTAHCIKVHEY